MKSNSKYEKTLVWKSLKDLFPLNRSLTGPDNYKTLSYVKKEFVPGLKINKVKSGSKVFDWKVPSEWKVKKAYIKNASGKKIVDFKKNNLHLVSYSVPFKGKISKKELLKHIHTLETHTSWIPYRTSYYSRNWGFCVKKDLINSNEFKEPFEVLVDTEFNPNGCLIYGEALKKGNSNKEILLSTYFCHPSLANDNLSGLITACILFKYLSKLKTQFSYRLVIVPETIGAICFLKNSNIKNIIGGTILTCTAGPDKLSIKEGFDRNHWLNKLSHYALNKYTKNNYIIYPFKPDGSDERQYSTPKFRIVTPSIHKSKYFEYPEYHTSADNLDFISITDMMKTINFYKYWLSLVDSYKINEKSKNIKNKLIKKKSDTIPKRKMNACEYQLIKYGLYPSIGGTLNQKAYHKNKGGTHQRKFSLNKKIKITGAHIDVFHWLMHLADGKNSNRDISKISGINLQIVNEGIALFYQKGLVKLL